MGNTLSNLSNSEHDLKNTDDLEWKKIIVMLTATPVFIINKNETEPSLSTGDDQLDELVRGRLNGYDLVPQKLSSLLNQQMGLNILTFISNNEKFYFTIEKNTKNEFTHDDCLQIRKLFDNYNANYADIVLLNKNEAQNSIFYDDLGDLVLGFIVDVIDYI